jgi:hypothetical protein
MNTRERRLSEFDRDGAPPEDIQMELLCQDRSGTYQLPFLCVWREGRWTNVGTGEAIGAEVVGWRVPKQR